MTKHDADAVVERIARRNAECWRVDNWDELDDDQKESYRNDARNELQDIVDCLKPGDDLGNGLVAVSADPTAAMLDAGHRAADDVWHSEDRGSRDPIAAVYRAMIAATSGE